MPRFVDVILPLPLPGHYTYSLPEEFEELVMVGCQVIVPFGQKKQYTALVVRLHNETPQGYDVKPINELLDNKPAVFPLQLKFWNWISSYYLCTYGEVYKAALPAGMKLESETKVAYNPDFEYDIPLKTNEQFVLDILSARKECTIVQLSKESGIRNVLPLVSSLLSKDALWIKEELRKSYKPKQEVRVRLTEAYRDEKQLSLLFDELKRAPKQLDLLMRYVELNREVTAESLAKKELMKGGELPASALTALVNKGVFEVCKQTVGRLGGDGQDDVVQPNPLNAAQQRAYDRIVDGFGRYNVCLLHGVTSSGKTELYIHLIQETIRTGKQVLYLLPEIALTTQITERLKQVFGGRLGIYHSRFPDAERVEIWKKQLKETCYDVILGARSSLFLPFQNLGLIIVDEEHENSYKQQDPAPRYHARNAAIMFASMCGAKVLLGTATPSVESYYNATTGKYALVSMTERYRNVQLPEITVVDIAELLRKKRMSGRFSPFLLQKMKEALANKEQAILFQNRRGFAPMLECRTCGWIPKCKYCDVSLTYHKSLNLLTCHYCGYTYTLPTTCPACKETNLSMVGFGTERVEDEIKELFPEAAVARLDMDTARTKAAYEKILADYQSHKIDILIGTQMVSKGLDFDHVSLVGILNADSLLNYPDFRAYERAYQLMAQVSGRAGRRGKRGTVILQTKSPDNPIIHQVQANDYEGMYNIQLSERLLFRYPPYYRLIYVYVKGREEAVVDAGANVLASRLIESFGSRVLGPDKPVVGRIQSLFIKKIVLKIEANTSMTKVGEYLLAVKGSLLQEPHFRALMVYYDVDPM